MLGTAGGIQTGAIEMRVSELVRTAWRRSAALAGVAAVGVFATTGLRPEPVARSVPLAATVTWSPDRPAQGSVFTIHVAAEAAATRPVGGTFAGERLHFVESESGAFTALAAVPVDVDGTLELDVVLRDVAGREERQTALVRVAPGEYLIERLTVAPEFGRPQPPEIQRRIEAESARALEVSRRSHDTPRRWRPPFQRPRPTRITSGFGHGREFNDQITSRHLGTDFAGEVGAPVVAPAPGVVALVDAFYLGGNVVYIDHGAGLVTGYLHLSSVEVAEGDEVESGQVIARVGATGRVTGPHLHWIVRYGTITVDGLTLLTIE